MGKRRSTGKAGKASKRREEPKTYAALAQHLGVSTATIARWRDDYDDWPARREDRSFDLRAVDAFVKRHQLGKHNPSRTKRGASLTLTEARKRATIERARRTRLAREREMVEHAKQLGELVALQDVLAFYRQSVATVTSVVEGFVAVKDRELPESAPSAEAWPKIRERIMELDGKLLDDVEAAMSELEE